MGNVIHMRAKNPDAEEGPEILVNAKTGEVLDEDGIPTGRTLEDLTDEYIPPFEFTGSQRELSLTVDSEAQHRVVGSMLKLKFVGGSLPIDGQYKMGERITLTLEVEVDEVHLKGVKSPLTGDLVGIDRIHTGTVVAGRDNDE